MSLPSSHVLPSSSFNHIGVMVMVMSFISCLSVFGYMNIKTITNTWFADIDNIITVEIPSYDPEKQDILTPQAISRNIQKIQKLLENDPVIEKLSIQKTDITLKKEAEALGIPLPAFMTLRLRADRAKNAEDRLLSLIKKNVPLARIQQAKEWQKDIEGMALNLKILFGAMVLSMVTVTAVIISATIRIQLKANQYVIELIHLMGAHAGTIASIFQRSILLPLCIGCITGVGTAFTLLLHLLSFMNINFDMNYLMIIAALLFLMFAMIGIIITQWTVVRSLWRMP